MKASSSTKLFNIALCALYTFIPLHHSFATEMYVQPSGVGIGLSNPVRQLHLRGDNAAFRMDRNVDGASFFMVRTDANWNPWKTFQVGVVSSGPNNGQFIINDLGQEVAGAGTNRMTITNTGDVLFTGAVRAQSFTQTSTLASKTNVQTIPDGLALVQGLRGVRFDWKDTGQPSIGLIAEEVQQTLPALVELDAATQQPSGVNYAALVGVLVEAVKTQQSMIDMQGEAIRKLTIQVNQLATQQSQ